MRISVIVPTLNDDTLKATLNSIRQQSTHPHEVIVVGLDEKKVTLDFPEVHFIDTERPVSAAAARNTGMQAATGDIFLFTDSDCLPYSDWVFQHKVLQEMNKQMVGGSVEIDNLNYWTRCDNVSMFHENANFQKQCKQRLLPTLNLSVHRSVWEKVGGMDESFPGAAAEDSDWTIRINKAGFPLYFEPIAIVKHAPSRTTWADVVRHWQNSGYHNIRVRFRHADIFKTQNFLKQPNLLRILSPFIAAWVTIGIYRQPNLWGYLATSPVVYLTKIIYCWSAARAIEAGYAFE